MIARVYQAINAVSSGLARDGVAKTRLNSCNNYLYRSIDDVLEKLAPLLAQHRLCILPRVLEREATDRLDDAGGLLVGVALKVAFDLVSAEDGSGHTIEAFGEALDAGDKATAKAMQSAYKYAVLQAFCVPALQQEDADAHSRRLAALEISAAPAEGWEPWCEALMEAVQSSASAAALTALQNHHRSRLVALARDRSDLYRRLGDAIGRKRLEFDQASRPAPRKAVEAATARSSPAPAVLGQPAGSAPQKTPAPRRRPPAQPAPGIARAANGSNAHG